MDLWLTVVLVIVVIAAVVIVIGRRALTGSDPTALTLDPGVVARTRALAEAGRAVEAIRVLRAGTPGLSLVHARTMVDRMRVRGADRSGSANTGDDAPAPTLPAGEAETDPGFAELPADVEAQVQNLVTAGRKADAVELVRTHTGWNSADSTMFVEMMR